MALPVELLDPGDLGLDVPGGRGGLLGQFLDLVGHHGKALARSPGARRFDGGVQRQQIGLRGDVGDRLGHLADLLGCLAELLHQRGHRGGVRRRFAVMARAFSELAAISPMVAVISSVAVATE